MHSLLKNIKKIFSAAMYLVKNLEIYYRLYIVYYIDELRLSITKNSACYNFDLIVNIYI